MKTPIQQSGNALNPTYLIATLLLFIMLTFQPGLLAQTTPKNHPALKTKQYLRSEWFASSRADSTGSMGGYLKALETHQLNQVSRNTPGNYQTTQWYPLGPSKTTHPVLAQLGLVISIWVDTSDFKTIYAGSNTGGIFKTTDGGENWISLADTVATTGVLSIQVDPLNRNNVFIGTGHFGFNRSYGKGVMKSTDGGFTWEQTGLNSGTMAANFVVRKIALLPHLPGTMLALVNTEFRQKGLIYRSTDGAQSWEPVYSENGAELLSIKPDPGNPAIIYVTGNRLLKSTDSGLTWTDFSNTVPLDSNFVISRVQIAKTADDPNLMLTFVENYDTTGTNPSTKLELFRSTDDGQSYSNINLKYNPFAGYWKMEFEISPANPDEFYLGGVWLFKYRIESDSAKYIDCSDHQYHHDVRELLVFPADGKDLLYMANDGGVSRSETGAESWQDITRNGMNNTQFHNIAIGENSNMMYAGPQDANMSFYNFTTGEWTRNAKVGDAYEGIIDHKNADIVYMVTLPPMSSQPNIFILKSIDGGKFFNYFGIPDSTETGRPDKPLAMDPVDPQTLYTGVRNVWKSLDGAQTWQKISDFPGTDNPSLIAVRIAPSNNKVIAAAFDNPNWTNPNPAKLWITPDGGNHWLNITPTGQYNIDYAGISDITFHPVNPQKIWLSLDKEWTDRRVYVTSNGGLSWQNYSTGLPSLPVNTITFVSGAGYDVLLAATDVGVYYRDENMNQWERFGRGLPLTIVSDLKISYNRKKIIAGTFGRGLWEADLCMPLTDGDIVINDSVEWSGKRKVLQNVILNPGARLTVSSTIEMGLDRKITVLPGAELLIDRGTITNDCAGMWDGIRLYGAVSYDNPSLPQGKVTLLHGGSVQYADTAIKTMGVDEQGRVIDGVGGGIIYANNASFINNYRGIEINSSIGNNPSEFTLCQFIINKSLPDGSIAGDLVSLKGASGVKFVSCRFENNLPLSAIPVYLRGTGINSFNSAFRVTRLPLNDTIPFGLNSETVFKQLTNGIIAKASTPAFSAGISKARFDRNLTGVYLAGINLGNINNCSFYLNSLNVDDSIKSASSAIYLDHCAFFNISGNVIKGPLGVFVPKLKSAGMVINRSGQLNHTIYGNSITNTNFAILAQNTNRSPDGNTGLRLLYNWFDANEYDICITNDSSETNNGIALHQGSAGPYPAAPAGNRFSHSKWHRDADMHNAGEFIFYHFYSEADSLFREPVSNYRVYPVEGNLPFPSDSAYRPDYMQIQEDKLVENLSLFDESSAQTRLTYLANLDGGNTALLLNEIESCTPANAPDLAAKLRQLSPYLSNEVLISLTKQQKSVPNTLIFEILNLNPHFTRNLVVIKSIEQMKPPLANYMLAALAQKFNQYSSLELLEAQTGGIRSARDLIFIQLALVLNESLPAQGGESPLADLLASDDRPESHYLEAFLAQSNLDYEEASTILSDIPVDFPEIDNDSHERLKDLMELNSQLFPSGLMPVSLNEAQASKLFQLSQYQETAIYATNMLSQYKLTNYREPYLFPGIPEFTPPPVVPPVVFSGIGFEIYPVPARGYVILDYYSESGLSQGELQISTISGQLVRKIKLDNSYGQQLINVSQLDSGTYIFALYDGSVRIGEQKVVIAR